ncbi:hypothetical protein AaE_002775 [Aphanomyces astaci]|uniref:Uncharacterized protein n=1 Tax=Aphanomyces astaci TaxID=112090 RepID=A0A6A5AXW0_APHAT|nr:hypothetical protein AaE_002775 [Aphanomyces astaci]
MYTNALRRLNIEDPEASATASLPIVSSSSPIIARGIPKKVYENVKVPATTGERIMKIRNICTRVENAVANTPHTYRLFMANMSTWLDGLQQGGYAGTLAPFTMPQLGPTQVATVGHVDTIRAAASAAEGVAPPRKSSERINSNENKSILSHRTAHPGKRKRVSLTPRSATVEAKSSAGASVSSRGRLQVAKQFDNFVV